MLSLVQHPGSSSDVLVWETCETNSSKITILGFSRGGKVSWIVPKAQENLMFCFRIQGVAQERYM